MDNEIEKVFIYNENSNRIRKFYQKKKIMISSQIREMKSQALYHRQLFERMCKPYLRVFQNNLYDLIEDLNNQTNLKILKFMVKDQSVRLSENDLCDLLEELVVIQVPGKFTLADLETRIITILSILEYIIFNVETFHMEPGYYEAISNQLENFRNYSSIASWATSLNHYIPTEETIHKYNIEFLLEYIFNILKVLHEDELQFRKVNLQVDQFLKVLIKSIGIDGFIENKGSSSFPPLEQSWERLRNSCNFGNSVSPFFTDYYLLKRIKMTIQTWSCEGDKIMISKYGKWLLMEFMWMHADNIWLEELKYNRKNSSNDEILTQYQLKNIVFLFGILDLMENYIIKSEHLSTLALVYHFAEESLRRTKSAPIQVKATVILLKLYFRNGNFFKIIDQDFERYFQDLNKEDEEVATHFKIFLSAIKPRLYQESISNDIPFENFRGTTLPQIRNKRKMLNDDKDGYLLNKNMIDTIANEMTCSVTLEPSESLCILECEHIISFETFLNLSRISRYRCPQCREDIQDYECIFLPLHHIYSFFYLRFIASGTISTPPILKVKATRPHYFSTPLLTFDSLTTPQVYLDSENIQSIDLPNKKSNVHNNSPRIRWLLKLPKKLHPAHNEALKALNNKHYEETVSWLTCLLQHYPNSYSTRCDRAFINSLLLHRHFLALKDLNIALSLKTKSPHAWNLRGETFRRIGYYDDALLNINQALQLAPDNAISHGIRGALFYEMKKFNESLKDLNYSLQQLPNNGFCLSFLGATLVKLGYNNDALANFNKALEINPEDYFVLIKRAKLYHALCLNSSGLIDINNALSINPCNHKALLIRGELNAALGSDSEALSDINKSLEMKPDNVNALKIRARLYHKMNRNEEALNDLDKAFNLKSNDISILELRGEIYRSMCYFEKAIDDFNQILQLDSRNIFALSYRGATKYDHELYEEALIDLNKALELRQENNLFILKTRAKIFIALERYHEALMDQNKILENEPNNDAILLERRKVYHRLGLCDKTRVNSPHKSRIALKSTHSC